MISSVVIKRAEDEAEGLHEAGPAGDLSALGERYTVGDRGGDPGQHRVQACLREAPADGESGHGVLGGGDRQPRCPGEGAAENPGPAAAEPARGAVRPCAGERVGQHRDERAEAGDERERIVFAVRVDAAPTGVAAGSGWGS